jgi:hypothetical protein
VSSPTAATTAVSFKQLPSGTKSPRRVAPPHLEDKGVQCSIMSLKGWIKRVPLSRSSLPNQDSSFRSGGGSGSSPNTHAFLRRGSLSPNPQSIFQEPYKSPTPIPFGDGEVGDGGGISSGRGSRRGSLSLGRTPSSSSHHQHPRGGAHFKLDGMWGDGSLLGGMDGSGTKSVYSHTSTPSFRPVSTQPAEPRDIHSPRTRSASPQPHYHQSGSGAARSHSDGSMGGQSSTRRGISVDLGGQQFPLGEKNETAAMSVNRRMEEAKRRAVESKFVVSKERDTNTPSLQADSLMSQLQQRRAGGGSGGAKYSRGRGGSRSSNHQPPISAYDRFAMPITPDDGGGFLQVTPLQ